MRAPGGGPLQITSADTLVGAQSGLKFTKSPRWNGRKLLFLDVHDSCVKSVDLSGMVQTVIALPYLPGGFSVRTDDSLIVGDALRRRIFLWDTGRSTQIADLSNVAGCCLSDGIVDSRGGMYFCDVGFDFLDPFVDAVPNGLIVYVNANGNLAVVAGNLFFPKGMLITPDNQTLIVAETRATRLTAFDIERDGSLRNRRTWAQFQDEIRPDGICLDRDGAIWVAGNGAQAVRVRDSGQIDRRVTTKKPVFSTMLGGPSRQHLFMCTADSDDPVITRRAANAAIEIVRVETPGIGIP